MVAFPMSERFLDDPSLPPPGRRSGAGSASILPYLLRSLATRPAVPAVLESAGKQRPAGGPPARGGLDRRS